MKHQIPITKQMKKAFVPLSFAALAIVLCLTGCSGVQGGAGSASGAKVEQKTYPFTFQKKLHAAPEESEMNLYFVKDGDIPYVALSEYLPFFGKLYEDEKLGTKALEFDIEQASGVYTATRANTPLDYGDRPQSRYHRLYRLRCLHSIAR